MPAGGVSSPRGRAGREWGREKEGRGRLCPSNLRDGLSVPDEGRTWGSELQAPAMAFESASQSSTQREDVRLAPANSLHRLGVSQVGEPTRRDLETVSTGDAKPTRRLLSVSRRSSCIGCE